jgi:hypothetical protein
MSSENEHVVIFPHESRRFLRQLEENGAGTAHRAHPAFGKKRVEVFRTLVGVGGKNPGYGGADETHGNADHGDHHDQLNQAEAFFLIAVSPFRKSGACAASALLPVWSM